MAEDPVKEALQYNIDVEELIWSLLTEKQIASNPRINLVLGYIVSTLEHQASIAKLIMMDAYGSAFVLLRSQMETALHALWVNLIATDEQVLATCLERSEPFPNLRPMAAQLSERYQANGLMLSFADHWKAVQRYDQSSLEQLGARFLVGGSIKRNCPDNIVAELLMLSSVISIELLALILRSMGFEEDTATLEQWMKIHRLSHQRHSKV